MSGEGRERGTRMGKRKQKICRFQPPRVGTTLVHDVHAGACLWCMFAGEVEKLLSEKRVHECRGTDKHQNMHAYALGCTRACAAALQLVQRLPRSIAPGSGVTGRRAKRGGVEPTRPRPQPYLAACLMPSAHVHRDIPTQHTAQVSPRLLIVAHR